MTLHIHLTAEIETRLRERAAAEGKDPARFALEAVQEKLGGNGSSDRPSAEARAVAWDRFLANISRWTQQLPPGHRVDDSRDSIYEGRGE